MAVVKPRTALSIAAATYWTLCLIILLLTAPWNGGDGSLVFLIWINLPSFPSGVVASIVLALITSAASGTAFENALSVSPLWWLSLFVGCGVLGFVQWFIVLPKVLERIRLLTTRSTGP